MPEKTFDLVKPNPSSLIESLRAFGYTPETAIADLVDNSISAGANQIDIKFHWSGAKSWVSIIDNGRGMNEDDLISAMTPGSRSPLETRDSTDLGRFGLGLKTASFSQCRVLTVASKAKNSEVVARQWDLDEVENSGEWRLLHVSDPQTEIDWHPAATDSTWTVIKWANCDRIVGDSDVNNEKAQQHFHRVIERVAKHLSMTFHRFIGGKKLLLKVNGEPVPKWDPFLENNLATQNLGEDRLDYRGGTAVVTTFILPHRSHLDSDKEFALGGGDVGWNALQGFYIYRQNRLLVAGDWLGLKLTKDEHYKLARIRIDISNSTDEQWQIDVRKSVAIPPPELRSELERIAKAARQRAVEIYRHRGKIIAKQASKGVKLLWCQRVQGGKIHFEIDRVHPAVETALADPSQGNVLALLRVIEETIPIPQISITAIERPEEIAAPFEGERPRQIVELATNFYEIFRRRGQVHAEAINSVLLTEPFHLYPEVQEDLAKFEKRKY